MTFSSPPIVSRRTFLRQGAGLSAGIVLARISVPGLHAEEAVIAQRDGKKLKILSADPMNAEPELGPLVENWITPVAQFFVRTHGTTPEVDAGQHRLTIEGLVERPLTLSLAQLQADYPKAAATATLTCAGNRRMEFNASRKVGGVQWGPGAIGNAEWLGTPLSNLLKAAGVKSEAKHVWFDSVDAVKRADGSTFAFGGSIPLDRALADEAATPGCLVAWQMNGKPLPVDHGFPLRTVVPGYIGARSVKWLGKITLSDRPSPNHFVQDVYKIVRTEKLEEAAKKDPIYGFPLNSAICIPNMDAEVPAGRLEVKGYALPNGSTGAPIKSVEVSVDGGQSWHVAKMTSPTRKHCWSLWSADVPVTAGTTFLLARAIDSAQTTQPKKTEWNAKGYLYDAWHRVPITLKSS